MNLGVIRLEIKAPKIIETKADSRYRTVFGEFKSLSELNKIRWVIRGLQEIDYVGEILKEDIYSVLFHLIKGRIDEILPEYSVLKSKCMAETMCMYFRRFRRDAEGFKKFEFTYEVLEQEAVFMVEGSEKVYKSEEELLKNFIASHVYSDKFKPVIEEH